MDGPEGETHPLFGALIMHCLFDWPRWHWVPGPVDQYGGQLLRGAYVANNRWFEFTLYHSRFYARRNNAQVSPLCIADKLAIIYDPTWFYVWRTTLTGEIWEYMKLSKIDREQENKYISMSIYSPDRRQWFENVKTYMRAWIKEYKKTGVDNWTPKSD